MGEQGSQSNHRRQCRPEYRRLGERRQWSEPSAQQLRKNEDQGASRAAWKEEPSRPRTEEHRAPGGSRLARLKDRKEPLRKEQRRQESARSGRGAGPDHLPLHSPCVGVPAGRRLTSTLKGSLSPTENRLHGRREVGRAAGKPLQLIQAREGDGSEDEEGSSG